MKKENKVMLGLAGVSAAGIGLYYLLRKKPEPICQEGQTQTRTCPDGVIVTAICRDGKWQATGAVCPTPPPPEIKAKIVSGEWLTVGGQCVARIKVKNIGNIAFTGHIGFSIKPINYTNWIDAPYRNVGTIETNEEKTFTSNPITIPGDAAPGDVEAWVTIKYYEKDYITLDEVRSPIAYVVEAPSEIKAEISNITVNSGGLVSKSRGDSVQAQFDIKNTSNFSTAFDLALEFDTMTDGHYDKFFDGVDTAVINPGQTRRYTLHFTVPNDAPLNHYYSIGIYAYPIGKFDRNNPKVNYIAKKSVYDVVYVS